MKRILTLVLAIPLLAIAAPAQSVLYSQQLGVSLSAATTTGAGAYFRLPDLYPQWTWQTVNASATSLTANLEGSIDGREVTDAAIASASHNLTSASAAFTSADAGKVIYVVGAASGSTLITTISSVTNGTTVVLAAAASTTVTSAKAMLGTWFVIGVSTVAGGDVQYVYKIAAKYVRCNLAAIAGGGATSTCQITVYK